MLQYSPPKKLRGGHAKRVQETSPICARAAASTRCGRPKNYKSGDESVRHAALAPYVNRKDPLVRLRQAFTTDDPLGVVSDPGLNTARTGWLSDGATRSGRVAGRVAASVGVRPGGACRRGMT